MRRRVLLLTLAIASAILLSSVGTTFAWERGCRSCCPAGPAQRPLPPVEVYFSPDGGARDAIIAELSRAQVSVDVAMYSFTSKELAEALIELHSRKVKVRVYMDRQQAGGKHSMDEVLAASGISVKVDSHAGTMHHKFAVIDDKVLITGSYNWSESAEERNAEDVWIIRKPRLAALFTAKFEKYWANP